MTDVVTLTLNPCVDVSTATPQVTATRKLRCAAPVRTPGGGGVNVARYLMRLGHSPLALHTQGGHTGEVLAELLNHKGVPHVGLPIAQDTRESLHVIEQSTGQEFRFVMPGPAMSSAEWAVARESFEAHARLARWAVLSGSLPPGVPVDAYGQLLRWCRDNKVSAVVDASGEALRHALAVGVTLVKPSLEELRAYSGQGLYKLNEQIELVQSLVAQSRAQVVVLSLGRQGALLAAKDLLLQATPAPTHVVSAVGAGDSLVAGLVSGLLQDLDLPSCLRLGMAVSAATIAQPPGMAWKKEDLGTLQSQVKLQVL
jgi:6-phosphofructokinase 2